VTSDPRLADKLADISRRGAASADEVQSITDESRPVLAAGGPECTVRVAGHPADAIGSGLRSAVRVGAVVVVHRSHRLAPGCVDGVLRDAAVESVVVIDNSHDAAVCAGIKRIRRSDQRVRYFAPPNNLGVAAGYNLGVALAGPVDFCCLVHPSVVLSLPPSAICAAMRSTGGVAAGQIVGVPGGNAINPCHQIGLSRELLALLIGQRAYQLRLHPPGDAGALIAVPRLDPSLLCVRRTDFEQLGGFDDDLELAYETADLCRRAASIGGVWLLPTVAGRRTEPSGSGHAGASCSLARAIDRTRYLRKAFGGSRLADARVAAIALAGSLLDPPTSRLRVPERIRQVAAVWDELRGR